MTDDDLIDAWSTLSKGTVVSWGKEVSQAARFFWCEESDIPDEPPLKKAKTRKSVSASEDKQRRVEDVKQKLVDKHGGEYSTMQYQLWAEMVAVGSHSHWILHHVFPCLLVVKQRPNKTLQIQI